ncbi:unnamed protein product [Acanthoscelides obtectus]|nr:unnamed protein product [Acanthoscelides obtectus]CAK1679283.1 Nose resistant to fluoxetine protein 6 [Acanthoscelides obtectus]
MRLLHVAVFLLHFIISANCLHNASVSDLPPIFHIDKNYEKCRQDRKLFCTVDIVLQNGSSNSPYWKLIQQTIIDPRSYNHNELFHAICIDDFCPAIKDWKGEETDSLKPYLSQCYTENYKDLELTAEVTNLKCSRQDVEYIAGFLDYSILYLFIIYITFIIYATYCDYSGRAANYLNAFSVVANWQRLVKSNAVNDSQKLRCIQGIRFYNMLLIILCHTYSSYIGGYVKNVEYFEEAQKSMIHLFMRNLFVFLVQTFFLFSAFLLSYHLFQVIETRKSFSIKCIVLTFVNRYLRIFPPVVLMLASGVTLWIVSFFHGPIRDLYSDLEYQMCRKNWWTTLFFINNHYNSHDMCYFISWYLSADTQLYILSLLILSLIWKFRIRVDRILGISFLIGILIPIGINYIYNLDTIYRITPENSKNNQFRSSNFSVTYTSMYANMATYMLGLSFGYVHLKVNNYRWFPLMVHKICWWLLFLGLPVTMVLISSYYYNRVLSALLCGLLKPLYALGVGVGVLGMSKNLGG